LQLFLQAQNSVSRAATAASMLLTMPTRNYLLNMGDS
jgi:hypothetical protein